MTSKEKGPNRSCASSKNLSKFLKKKKREKEKGDELRTCEEKEDEIGDKGGGLSTSKKKVKKKHNKEITAEENILDSTQKGKKKDDTKRTHRKKSSKRGERADKKDDKKDDKKEKEDDKKKENTQDEPNTVFEVVKAPAHPAHSNNKHMNAHFLKDLKKLHEGDKKAHDEKSKDEHKKKKKDSSEHKKDLGEHKKDKDSGEHKKDKDSGEHKKDSKDDDHRDRKEKAKTPPQNVDDGFLPTVFEHINAPVSPANAEKKIKRHHHHKDKDKDKEKEGKSMPVESEAVPSIQGEIAKPVYQTLPKKDIGVAVPGESAAVSMYSPDGLAIVVAKADTGDLPSTSSAIESSDHGGKPNEIIEHANAEPNCKTAMIPLKYISEVHYKLTICNGVKRYEPILVKHEKEHHDKEITDDKPQKRGLSPPSEPVAMTPRIAKSCADSANKPLIEVLPGTSPPGETDANKKDLKDVKDAPALAPMSMYVAPINEEKKHHDV